MTTEKQNHTEGLLHSHVNDNGIPNVHTKYDGEHYAVVSCLIHDAIDAQTAKANAMHIVACWNSCAGLNPEAVPGLVEALKSIGSVKDPHRDPHFYELNGGPVGVIAKIVTEAQTALAAAKEGE